MLRTIVIALLFLVACIAQALSQIEVHSPHETVAIAFRLDPQGAPQWCVTWKGEQLLDWSPLGLTFRQGGALASRLTLIDSTVRMHDETYELVIGKTRQSRDHFRELCVKLEESVSPHRRLDLVFRAYDDGAAFRYSLPAQNAIHTFEITRENTEFHFPEDMKAWAFQINTFHASFEGLYLPSNLSNISDTCLIHPPITLQRTNGPSLAITEAELTDYAGMYLRGLPSTALQVVLAPRVDDSRVCVRGKVPFLSPWRVLLIGDKPGDLIESTLILNLSSPCVLADVSWIKPGKAIFPWWPNFYSDKPGVASKLDFENQKYYVDFAAENNIEYLELEPPWYGPEGDCIANPSKYDITKPIPELQLPALFEHARKKNVGIFLWAHWENVDRQADTAFALYAKWGAVGVKIDFMNRDDQETIRWYPKILKKAAKHHLMVYFHGTSKPTGTQRTYPNLVTLEGVLGNEQNKVGTLVTPEHTVTIPFTRMLAGPMDFTPGGFRNATAEQFKPNYDRPMVMGTRCRQLAMFVVYESPLVMVVDDPGAYRNEPGLTFLQQVPTTWDETRVLEGQIGEHIVIARRRGSDWYLGAMTDWTAREIRLPLGFVGPGNYQAELYQDGANADTRPTEVAITRTVVTANSVLSLRLAKGGGLAARLTKK